MNPGRSLHRQKGSELVEFAISATLLFILLFGIIEFSVALFDKATLTNAAREGAREGILFRPEPRDNITEDAEIKETIDKYLGDYLITLNDEKGGGELGVVIDRPAGGTLESGDELSVTVTYKYEFLVLPGFLADLDDGILDLSTTVVMRAE